MHLTELLKPKWTVTFERAFWKEAKISSLTLSILPFLFTHCIHADGFLNSFRQNHYGRDVPWCSLLHKECTSLYFSVNMGWTYCPSSGLTIQVRILPGLQCKSSATGFAVVRMPAMPSVLFMLTLLNTCTIIIFGLIFLKLFPPYSRITEKIYWLPAYFLGHPKATITLQFSLPFPGSCLHITRLSTLRKNPNRDKSGWTTKGRLPRNCSRGEQKTRGLWIVLTGLLLCLELLSKESGSAMLPSQRLVQFPAGGRLFSTLHPYGREMGLIGTRKDKLVGSSPGASPTEKAGNSCRDMWGKECCWSTIFLIFFLFFLELDLITTVLANTKDFRITRTALLPTLVLLYHQKSSRTLHHCHTLKFCFSFSASLPFSTEFELLMAYDFEKSRRTTLVFGLSLVPFSPFICTCGSCFFLFAGTLFHHIAVWVGSAMLLIRTNRGPETDEI